MSLRVAITLEIVSGVVLLCLQIVAGTVVCYLIGPHIGLYLNFWETLWEFGLLVLACCGVGLLVLLAWMLLMLPFVIYYSQDTKRKAS